jgi:hypothetical protein
MLVARVIEHSTVIYTLDPLLKAEKGDREVVDRQRAEAGSKMEVEVENQAEAESAATGHVSDPPEKAAASSWKTWFQRGGPAERAMAARQGNGKD